MALLFRSSFGPWSVWSCNCCGDPVKFTDVQERDWVKRTIPDLYIAHHAPLGTPWERKGERYDFIAEPPTVPAVESEPLTAPEDCWDEKTPVTGSQEPLTSFDEWWPSDDY